MSDFVDSISPLDEYCFQIRPHMYWLAEPEEDELERLQWNIWLYEEYIKNNSKFPREIHEARQREYIRVRFLKQGLQAA